MGELTEIRLLGSLRVRRPDGSAVDPREWRTAKTRDLLRILAVHGAPVPSEQVVDALWPHVPTGNGRASLRTAASQIRRVLGADCLERVGPALVLRGVWVDVAAFEAEAAEARRRFAQHRWAEGMGAARRALSLYAGELSADDPYADWVVERRRHLDSLHRGLLVESAEAAATLGWTRDAVALARHCLDKDATSERACRVLMRAHAAMAETDLAVAAFEHCRRALAEELGIDPSGETLTVHQQILRRETAPPGPPRLLGRDAQLRAAREAVRAAAHPGEPRLVLVTGTAGLGKTRLEQALAAADTRSSKPLVVDLGPLDDVATRDLVAALVGADPSPALTEVSDVITMT